MSVLDSEAAAWRPPRGRATALQDAGTVASFPAPPVLLDPCDVRIDAFGQLVPISRCGGQGRVYSPARLPVALGPGPVVVKLYRRPPPAVAAEVLAGMVSWGRSLEPGQRARLQRVTAWPLRVVSAGGLPVGIAMQDVSSRFSVPFVMPSGRREHVLLALEHLLGADVYLQLRGLKIALDTVTRARVAERVSGALAFLHRHAVVASDIAPSNVLVGFGDGAAEVCLIDCDSMVFRGRNALASVETGDWDVPASFGEPPRTRATDAYKLGLVVLRLFARSHDARTLAPHLRHVPTELRDLLYRALAPDSANRPPPGEWQRVLDQLLANGRLNDRYPGPTPPPPPQRPATQRPAAPRPAAPRPPVASLPPRRLAHSLPASTPSAPAVAPRPPLQAGGLRIAVMLLWLAALALVAGLVISRLLAIAAPPQDGAGFGPGLPAVAPQRTPYYQYYGPPSGGRGIPYVPYQ